MCSGDNEEARRRLLAAAEAVQQGDLELGTCASSSLHARPDAGRRGEGAAPAFKDAATVATVAGLTHVDDSTNQPTMVDVQAKQITAREAAARASIRVPPAVMRLLGRDGEIMSKKGPVFATAIIAGTMAVKQTHNLIPFCHALMVESCKVTIQVASESEIEIVCKVAVSGKTGVEMEALTGASVAALTIYDMCKGVSHDMVIGGTRLLTKSGGKSDYVSPDRDAAV